jgi:hypothetical protein
MTLRKLRWALWAYVCFDLFFGGICGGFLLLTPLAAAQFTTVSGTVTDPNGLPYANGTISAQLVISASPVFTATKQPYTPPTQPVGLSPAGSFVMQLADVTALSPGGGTYSFKVSCAAGCVPVAGGKGPISFTVTGITISGASQSITTTLTAAAPALSNSAGGGGTVTTVNGTTNQLDVVNPTTTPTVSLDPAVIFPGTVTVPGVFYPNLGLTQTGAAGTTEYRYCVVATDVASNTKSVCQTTYAGNATLNGTNFNVVTVTAFSSTSPYILPIGSCNVYRTVSGGTPSSVGKIGTIASCSAGGSLNDTGLAGDTTTPPLDTSGNNISATLMNGLRHGTVTFGAGAGSIYDGFAIGENSYPARINGITGTSAWPIQSSEAQGYGYSVLDIGPSLFTGPAPSINGNSRTIMGLNVGLATAFPDTPVNVMAMNGQLVTPTTYSGNQWQWYGLYHESDHWGSGTLHGSYGAFTATYNNGNGACASCVGGHFEAIGNFYGGTNTPLTSYNAGLECNSGVNANATHTNDYCFHALTPVTGGTFTNGHAGILIDDQSAGGAIAGAYGIRMLPGSNGYIGLHLSSNPMLVASGSGAFEIFPSTGLTGNFNIFWPATQGTMATSACPSGAKVFLSSDFTSANASGLQAITGLSCVFPALNAVGVPTSFECSLAYSQATNVASDQFGLGFTGTITNFNAWAMVATNTGAATPFTTATVTGIASNTPTSVVTFQPGNTGLNVAKINGTVEYSSAGTFQVYVTNGTAADVIVVKRSSFCQFF